VLLALPALKEPAERLFADRVLCTLIGVLPATERGRRSFATSPEPFMASASGDELLASIQRTAAAWRARAGAVGAPDARHGSRAVRASWSEAALVTAKTMVGMALVTAIWFGTGWRYGSVMLMSASVFLTLFSSNASARALVRQILLGSAGGALAAVLYVAILPASATPREAVLRRQASLLDIPPPPI
jgi:uncharacterized membrane protein YccC